MLKIMKFSDWQSQNFNYACWQVSQVNVIYQVRFQTLANWGWSSCFSLVNKGVP